LIAIITVGSLSFPEIDKAKDYVLAEAAKPQLGNIGFTIITVAALLSTFSAINAPLYGVSRVSYEISEDDELPDELSYKLWNKPVGLMITAVATLIITNTLNLESISTAGSIGFLLIFAMVNFVGFKLAKEINGNKTVPLIGFVTSLAAMLVLTVQQYHDNLIGIMISWGIILFCFVLEWVFKKTNIITE
jgi:amino acid transporter